MRIQLISADNGFGLSKDIQVLRDHLSSRGHEVDFTDWRSPRKHLSRHHYDANIFLELLSPSFFGQARLNYAMPNPEWFMGEWEKHLSGIDLVLCKTRDCERIFSGLCQTRYTGFTSPDIYKPTPKRNAVLHLEGKSITKGTDQVRQAARMLPDVEWVFAKSNDTQLIQRLQNECWIHCQPSLYEGFGHVLNEARACGSILVTTAAPPMTDIARPEYAYGVPHIAENAMRMAVTKTPDPHEIAEAVKAALERTDKERLGTKAREAYLSDRKAFHDTLDELFPA